MFMLRSDFRWSEWSEPLTMASKLGGGVQKTPAAADATNASAAVDFRLRAQVRSPRFGPRSRCQEFNPGPSYRRNRSRGVRPLGQAGPAGSGFSNWSSHHIGAEAIPDGFGVSMFHMVQRYAQQTNSFFPDASLRVRRFKEQERGAAAR